MPLKVKVMIGLGILRDSLVLLKKEKDCGAEVLSLFMCCLGEDLFFEERCFWLLARIFKFVRWDWKSFVIHLSGGNFLSNTESQSQKSQQGQKTFHMAK